MIYLNLYLIGGHIIKVSCEELEYEEIYEAWAVGTGVLAFEEGCVQAANVVFIEYLDE